LAASEVWVTLGYVARTHGVRGTLRLHWHDSIAQLAQFPKQLRLTLPKQAPQVFDVKTQRPNKEATLVDFTQITTMDAAAIWRGAQVDVPESALPPVPEGEVYLYRLMGAACVDLIGRPLGRLVQIYNHGSAVVLGICDAAGEEHLVPLLDDTLKKVVPATDQEPLTLRLAIAEGLWAP
jgi:16S rRNA processing protein RimM